MHKRSHKKTDRIARLLRLQFILWQHPRGLTVQDIARMCDISYRTVYRDLHALETIGVPVWADGANKGMVEGHFLPPITFSAEEAIVVFLAARMMQRYFGIYSSSMAATFMKLNVIIPSPLREQIRNIIEHSENLPKNEQISINFSKLIQAWLTQRQLRITYQELFAKEATERIIEPYFIEPTPERRSYHVIAYCHFEKKICALKLSRFVGEIQLCSSTFKIPKKFNAIDYLRSAWGVYTSSDVETVKLKFHKMVSKTVMQTIWHSSQKTEVTSEGNLIMTLEVDITVDLRNWILGFSDMVEVLEPKSLRNQVVKAAKAILNIYKKSGTPERISKIIKYIEQVGVIDKLTNEQWNRIQPLIPKSAEVGRPRADDRKTLEGILWVLSRKAKWADLPKSYGSPATCHSRMQQWEKSGLLRRLSKVLF